MEYTSIDGIELGLSCIVCIGYIVGKVWMYYRIEDKDTKKQTKQKPVIRRGREWPE